MPKTLNGVANLIMMFAVVIATASAIVGIIQNATSLWLGFLYISGIIFIWGFALACLYEVLKKQSGEKA